MVCRWCGKDIEPRGHRPRLFCNATCRGKAWQQGRQDRDRQIRWHLEQAVRLLGGSDKNRLDQYRVNRTME